MANEEEAKQSGTPENSGDGASANVKQYSQIELDRMFAERAKQAEQATLKRLGFERVEDAEAVVKRARDYDEAQKTELQKLQDKLAEKERHEQELIAAQKKIVVRSEVLSLASKAGIADAEAAYRLIDHEAIKYNDDGTPANLDDLLKDVIKEHPFLVGSSTSSANPARGRGEENDPFIVGFRKGAGLDKKG